VSVETVAGVGGVGDVAVGDSTGSLLVMDLCKNGCVEPRSVETFLEMESIKIFGWIFRLLVFVSFL